MKKVCALIIIQALFFSCNVSLMQDKIKTWFYGLPIYDSANNLTKQLLLDNRFIIEQFPDTTKDAYIYKARIKNPNLPTDNIRSDSSVIDFTFFKIKSKSGFVISTLLSVNHYFSNNNDLEKLYNMSYGDLKSFLNKAHDIIQTIGNDTTGVGKKIFYKSSEDISQTIEILKKKHSNGSLSLEMTFMVGEK